ncbi:MAG: hypothetical protein AAF674_06505 [Pseudomonadota bacterium]
MSKLTLDQSKTAHSGSWWGPVFGVFCLIAVQVGFVGIALWPAVLGDEEFVRYDRVTVIDRYTAPADRWLIRLSDEEEIPMPPPDGIAYRQDTRICVGLSRGTYGNLRARLADPGDCPE